MADWRDSASCARSDPDEWFPDHGRGRNARRICAGCPVRRECFAWALGQPRLERSAIYAGHSGGEIMRMRRKRQEAAA
jgi:WhiB family transcriptional regulator, redox-sensing transcriptional regulator